MSAQADTANSLCYETGGSGSPTLVLLHGLGANLAVWDGLRAILAQHWPARWIAPDLRGHGRSPHRQPYSLGIHAADVAALFQQDEEVVLLGHSMGGAVAMVLATGLFGIRVRHVVAVGVRLEWRPEDLAKAYQIARSPVRWFSTRSEASDFFLRVSGLKGLAAPDSACVARGISECSGRFRLAMDPLANLVAGTAADFSNTIHVVGASLCLAAGEHDPMTNHEQMRRYTAQVAVLPGLGHNLHVEAPEKLWEFAEPLIIQYASRI